jgi:hypothetical protein
VTLALEELVKPGQVRSRLLKALHQARVIRRPGRSNAPTG